MDGPDCSSEAAACQETACGNCDEFDHDLSKAEQHLDLYLKSLKVRVADGSARCMVGRRGRDLSGRLIYVCFPCGALCGGENVLQAHLSGNKHRHKMKTEQVWPTSIFDYYPAKKKVNNTTPQVNTAAQTKSNNSVRDEFLKYEQYRSVDCHLQESLNSVKTPLLGLEYLVEHPPEKEHYSPLYMCTLCMKQGQSGTILSHLTSYRHRHMFLTRHFPKACEKLHPYINEMRYSRDVLRAVTYIQNILAQRIEDKYGRKRPVNIDKEEYEQDQGRIHRWLFQDHHFSENDGSTFEEVINEELLQSLFSVRDAQVDKDAKNPQKAPAAVSSKIKDGKNQKADPRNSLSDFSEPGDHQNKETGRLASNKSFHKACFEPYKRYAPHTLPNRNERFKQKQPNHAWKLRMAEETCSETEDLAKKTLDYHLKNPEKHPLYPEEWKKFWSKRYKEIKAEGKDPAKYDFKPEWIVFWTARMKHLHEEELRVQVYEIYRKLGMTAPDENQKNSSSASSNDIQKPEPSARRLLSPLDQRQAHDRRASSNRHKDSPDRRKASPDCRRSSPDRRRLSPDQRRSSERRRSSPDRRRSSPDSRRPSERRRLSPDRRRSSPDRRRSSDRRLPSHDWRRSSPDRRRAPHRTSADRHKASPHQRTTSSEQRRASSDRRRNFPDQRTANPDRCLDSSDRHKASPDRRKASPHHRKASTDRHNASPGRRKTSPDRLKVTFNQYKASFDRRRSSPDQRRASPDRIRSSPNQRNSRSRERQPGRTDFSQDRRYHHTMHLAERCRSPSRHKRSRSRSPLHRHSPVQNRSHERARHIASSLRTKNDWNSDNELVSWASKYNIDSIMSSPDATTMGLPSANRLAQPFDDVMATLRHLVALEDFLGSLGPRVVDLLSEALTMEKQRPNSSAELLERESALVLLETAKEKLKGAAQAGLVSGSAAAAVRAAVVRVAATLHEADRRVKRKKQERLTTAEKVASVPVGAGEIDRAQIAEQIAVELIAQGKTDVTPEELAQLVEAVVSMTETKKRQNEKTRIAEVSDATGKPLSAKLCGTECALQALQAAYEKDKKSKEDSLDAIIDLSDSDVETLLKNFHQLSSEEQYNLAAYLKKLEANEPQRMEHLNQYVNNATTTTATPADSQQDPVNNERQTATPVEAKNNDHTDTTRKQDKHSATLNIQKFEIAKQNIDKPNPEQINQEKSLEIYLKEITCTDMFALIKGIQTTSAAPNIPEALPSVTVFDPDELDSLDDLLEDLKTGVETSQPLIQDSPKRPETVMTPQSILLEASNMESSYTKQEGMFPLKHEQEQPDLLSPQLSTQHIQQSCNNQNLNSQTQQNRPPLGQVRESKHFNDNRHQWFQDQFTDNNMQDNRGTAITGPGPNNNLYNQGPRYNFINGRGQINSDTRPQNVHNQFGRFENQQNSFRGKGGRGFYNGGMRGRGRGYY